MKDAWRHFIAEFIGTFALVFVGSGAIMSTAAADPRVALIAVAIAHGIVLSVMVTALMRISGHFNPAITLGFVVTRRIEAGMAVVYWIAQFTGAIVAAWALKGLFPPAAVTLSRLGGQFISGDTTLLQAIVLEAIATFFLAWVVFGTAVDPRAPKVGGFAIGLTIAAEILAIGPLTGASMNPARSFGPAVVSGVFEGQTAYWIGPIVGAVVAALLYDRLFLPRDTEPALHGPIDPVA
jgi:MIP family channel proteins